MTYVGAVPTTGDFKKLDAITASATATYNLRQGGVAVYPQSSSHCLVVLNGILQTGGSSFNIVNDTIVFAEALTSSDVINQILVLGNVNDIGVPSDDTVSTAKLQSSAVTDAKISAMASSKLTGVVPTANLGSGTASSSTVLFGDQTFKTAPSGGFVRLNGVNSSSVSDITFDNFTSTYQVYKIIGSHTVSDNNAQTRFRVRKSGSDQTSSHYRWAYNEATRTSSTGAIDIESNWNVDYCKIAMGSSNNNAHPTAFELTIFSPNDSTRQSGILLHSLFFEAGGADKWTAWNGSVWLDSTTGVDVTGIKIYPSAGTIVNAKYSIYGLKDS